MLNPTTLDKNVFNELQQECFTRMVSIVFKKFKLSHEYADFLQKVDTVRESGYSLVHLPLVHVLMDGIFLLLHHTSSTTR